ncbi:uncharacterized protein [Typha angustifolia]|uniref:uncharacterized protein isoform X2 n=1 Tax=Typha angustifolia TaxID=59011 RepID=UPI003C2C3424
MLHYTVMGNAPDIAKEIAMKYPDLISSRNTFAATPLHLMLTITGAFRSKLQLGFLSSIIYNCIPLEEKKFYHGEELDIATDEEKQSLITLRGKFPKHCSTLCDLLELIYRFPGWRWIRQLVFIASKHLFPGILKLKQSQKQAMDLILLMASYPDTWDFYN